MELGVHSLNTGAALAPATTARLARRAEQLGYRSWWAADHVVLPSPGGPGSPMAPTDPILDPIVHLTYVAAVTERLELGTGIVILPQRNPLVLAKQAASLDVLSGGRLLLGVGAGWLEPELTAVGVPMAERGRRTDEYLDAMTALWTEPAPAYRGRFVHFEHVDAYPRPVQPGGPRVVIGGHSPAAYRRAVSRGHGWFGNGGADELAGQLDGLAKAASEVDRPARLGRLEITYMPLDPGGVEADTARRFADLGVHRLLLFATALATASDVEHFLERHADLPR
jgi:probable F420-dependent oxidoreductase